VRLLTSFQGVMQHMGCMVHVQKADSLLPECTMRNCCYISADHNEDLGRVTEV
jgi:hypothetical protein